MDTAAVAALMLSWRMARDAGGVLCLGPRSQIAERALAMFRLPPEDDAKPRKPGFFERLGDSLLGSGRSLLEFTQLAADATFSIGSAITHPRKMRWAALIDQCIYIGSQALPIVGLICFLIGLTVAFQSAYQLRQFGGEVFVANLTGVAMVREMGPLMCAILVAGRSGSSIAAEIATMKVSEEIDALSVMGMEPVAYLAVPRLLAICMMMPLLTILADFLGILGGFIVGIFYLDIAFTAFLNQTLDAIVAWDLISGLLKSLVFGFGIGLIGLFYGFRVQGGAGEVGRTTTTSVVASIFYIILSDCAFSVLFYVVV